MRALFLLFLFLCSIPAFALSGGQWVQSTVSVNSTGVKAANIKIGRVYLLIVNKGSSTIYIKIDGIPSSSQGIPVPAGGNFEPQYPPYNEIWIKTSSGTQDVEVVEG